MAELPKISPDESTDQPRCRAECGSASRATCGGKPCHTCIDCEAAHDTTEVGLVCQPRLLQAYAELREIKARRCDGCESWRPEDGDRTGNCLFAGRGSIWPESGYCHMWMRASR